MTEPLPAVLFVEDNPGDALLVREALRDSGAGDQSLTVVETLAAALALLHRERFEIILLDLNLPDSNGLETIRTLMTAAEGVPVVVLTGLEDADIGLAAIRAGAQDYLVKTHISGPVLGRVIRYAVERNRIEERLRSSEASFRTAQRLSRTGTWERFLSTGVETWSAETFRLLGLHPDAVDPSRRIIDKMIHPDDRGALGRLTEEGLADEDVIEMEFRVVRPDDKVADVHSIVEVIRDSKRRPIHLIGAMQDITDRKQAGLALERANRAYATLSAANQALIRAASESEMFAEVCGAIVVEGGFLLAWIGLVADDETRIIHPVATCGEDAGFVEAMGVIGSQSGIPPDPATSAIRTGAPVIVADVAADAEPGPWRDAALARRIASSIALPIISDSRVLGVISICSDEPNAFVGSVMDLLVELAHDIAFGIRGWEETAQRHRAEELIRQEKERAEQYLDIAANMFVALDASGNVTLINRAACRVLRCEAHEAIGADWFESFLPPGARDDVRTVFDRLMRGEIDPVSRVESEVLTKDGERRLIRWHNTVIREEVDAITGTLSSGEDITERRQAEEQLRHVQKMESLGNLAGGIAHDFNNMLLPIIALTEMTVKRLPEGGSDRERLTMVLQAARRAKDLVAGILAFGRRDSPVRVALDIRAVVAESLELLRSTLPATMTKDVALDDAVGTVFADKAQIQTVLMNLATNAADALMGMAGTLTVRLTRMDVDDARAASVVGLQPGAYAVLTMADTGIGMDEKTLERMFDPFFTTKDVGRGTGLGLAMAHGIVTKHGGAIAATSSPGEGTTFQVYLPLQDSEGDS